MLGIVNSVDVHPTERIGKILGKFVYIFLISLLLPSFKLTFLVDTLDMRDEVSCIALVENTITRRSAKRVHVASLSVSIYITERLSRANNADFDLLDRLLIILRAMLVLKVHPQVNVLRKIVLHSHMKLAPRVLALVGDYPMRLVLVLAVLRTTLIHRPVL